MYVNAAALLAIRSIVRYEVEVAYENNVGHDKLWSWSPRGPGLVGNVLMVASKAILACAR